MRLDCSPCTVQTQNVCLGYCDLLRQVATLCSTLKSWVNILSSRYLLIYSRPVPRIEPPTRFIDYTATLLRLHTFTQLSRIIFRTVMNYTEQSPSESNNRSAGQQIPGLVRKVKFHYRVQSDNTLRQMNPLHNLTLDLSTSLLSTRHGPVESTHTSYTRAPGITARPKARISWGFSWFY